MAYLNSHGPGKGFEQSGGGYFYVADLQLATKLQTWGGTTQPSGSGGAWQIGSFAPACVAATGAVSAALPGNTSSLFASGRIVRDMGKTLVSAGRTFRKIKGLNANGAAPLQGVGNADAGPSAGVGGNSIDQGYLTFYVETTRDGVEGVTPVAPVGLVRYM